MAPFEIICLTHVTNFGGKESTPFRSILISSRTGSHITNREPDSDLPLMYIHHPGSLQEREEN